MVSFKTFSVKKDELPREPMNYGYSTSVLFSKNIV